MTKPIALAGCLAIVAALVIIWGARLSIPRSAYVSELGAAGEPTAPWFQAALLLVVVGGSAIAWAGRHIRSTASVLGRWTPSISLWIGCGFFLLASQVTCTAGCPLPVGDTFTWQDFTHTAAAVLAFAAACMAMIQASFAVGHPGLARMSLLTGFGVAVSAAVGGVLSLARVWTTVGGLLEFVATTFAIGWLVMFGLAVVRGHGRSELTEAELSSAIVADHKGLVSGGMPWSVSGAARSRAQRGGPGRGSRSRPVRPSGTGARS